MPGLKNKPQQDRSRRTLERYYSAGRVLFSRMPVAEVSVPMLVKEARSSVGAFYSRFKDKSEYLATFYELYLEAARERWRDHLQEGRWQGYSAREFVNGLVQLRAAYYVENRPLTRSLLLYVRQAEDTRFIKAARAITDEAAVGIGKLLSARPGLKHTPDADSLRRALIIADAPLREWFLHGRGSRAQKWEDESVFVHEVGIAMWAMIKVACQEPID